MDCRQSTIFLKFVAKRNIVNIVVEINPGHNCISLNRKKVALIDWRLMHGVWPFITSGAFLGKTCCVCGDSTMRSNYAYATLLRSEVGALLGLCHLRLYV